MQSPHAAPAGGGWGEGARTWNGFCSSGGTAAAPPAAAASPSTERRARGHRVELCDATNKTRPFGGEQCKTLFEDGENTDSPTRSTPTWYWHPKAGDFPAGQYFLRFTNINIKPMTCMDPVEVNVTVLPDVDCDAAPR